MSTIVQFPPPGTSREVFLAVRKVIPALTFKPDGKVWLNGSRVFLPTETLDPHHVDLLRSIGLPTDGPNYNAAYFINLAFARMAAGSLVMTAANRAMESLECSIDNLVDTLRSEQLKPLLVLLVNTIDAAMDAPGDEGLFDYIWETQLSNIQKAIETIFPEVKRKKAQSLAGKKTGENHSVLRELFLKRAILLVEKDKTCRYNDVIEDGKVTIGPKCRELNIKIPRDQVLRKWLKAAEKEGRLAMPPTASKPGRPTK